jgi:hypothetical protein
MTPWRALFKPGGLTCRKFPDAFWGRLYHAVVYLGRIWHWALAACGRPPTSSPGVQQALHVAGMTWRRWRVATIREKVGEADCWRFVKKWVEACLYSANNSTGARPANPSHIPCGAGRAGVGEPAALLAQAPHPV